MSKYVNYYYFLWGMGGICKLSKFSNKLLTVDHSSGIHIGMTKVLQLWKINHGNDFVKLA